mgnify:CR=1 FL=1
MNAAKRDRYPGMKAFDVSENHIFFGRDYEVNELIAQVKANKLVVLFAKSGIGKSSLINAGLTPKFQDGIYKLIRVRLQNQKISPTENLKNELEPYFKEEKVPAYAKQEMRQLGLWEYIKACTFDPQSNLKEKDEGEGDKKKDKIPIIIFDQFEEFFNHSTENQDQLIRALSDLVSERLPHRIRQSLRSIPIPQRKAEDLNWHSPIEIKILFAIRSDQLDRLDNLKERIPSILSSRFQLRPLSRQQAKRAIIEPAKIEDAQFRTAPFDYTPQALEDLLNQLSDKNGEIASFSLQLVCQHIERSIRQRQWKN